jgi:hypothetical protein
MNGTWHIKPPPNISFFFFSSSAQKHIQNYKETLTSQYQHTAISTHLQNHTHTLNTHTHNASRKARNYQYLTQSSPSTCLHTSSARRALRGSTSSTQSALRAARISGAISDTILKTPTTEMGELERSLRRRKLMERTRMLGGLVGKGEEK